MDKKRFNWKKILAILGMGVLMFATLFVFRAKFGGPVGADAGDFGGDSDYDFGGWDSGSDWDSDWGSDSGSDWSWSSNDDDDDWNWGSNGNGNSWSSGGSGYNNYDSYRPSSEEPSDATVGLIVIIWIVVIVLIIMYNRKNKKPGVSDGMGSQPAVQSREDLRTPQSELQSMAEYKKLDPNFDESKLQQRLSNAYVQMQNCWTAKNLEPLRPYLSDAMYAQLDRQLQQNYVKGRRTNHVDNISVNVVNLRGFKQVGDQDQIIVELVARITDYTVDDRTGQVVRGTKDREKFMTYEWSVTRTKGMKTEESEGLTTITCPHCGAPVNLNESAKCPYCGSILTVEKHDWVVSNIKGIKQQTV